ncbi:TetR/AcrR family transcriptional regulator [Tsukamurella ocularis]|uniref:TetR/AcrR family transcriptional regulator n=1 Tax=Tsukamurella ocularis TaxID=1970234 RepID=UPI002167D5B2|nr:TetR/AcrR family transcriptional regulator [Tsukamurella ocularis]MCS3788119.1 AcrR family transcriptional regulator [Tsukamurella ocularis]MCS3851839.1 AcrR family transcriptional regulator [Tsukamurella ocularis]
MTETGQARNRRRPTKGDQREAAILATGRRLLDEKPLSAITIDELARGAGLSRSAFYFYFDSKDTVVYTLITNSLNDLGAILDEFADIKPPRTAIRHAVAKYLTRWVNDGPLLRAMVPSEGYYDRLDGPWRAMRDRISGTLGALIDAERSAGRAPAGPAGGDIAAALMAMMWRAGWELSLADPVPADLERTADTLTAVFVRTIWCAPQ